MYHTWTSIFFLIVLCCPVVVAAENGSSETKEQGNPNMTFRDCVLQHIEWKEKCANTNNRPLAAQDNNSDIKKVSEKTVPLTKPSLWGPVWGPTPAEVYRKYYFPDQQK